MNNVIKKIDRALKRLYNIDLPYRAEDFLLENDVKTNLRVGAGRGVAESMKGALYLKSAGKNVSELSLGIFLSPEVRETLSKLRGLNPELWTTEQMGAFTVAAEEISHFHYLLYHASNGRAVRQLELELHGEIDKFVLAYFARPRLKGDGWFEALFEQLFVKFRFRDDLTSEEKIRYATASDFAKKFLLKIAEHLASPDTQDKAVRLLRWFYRLENAEKISFLHS